MRFAVLLFLAAGLTASMAAAQEPRRCSWGGGPTGCAAAPWAAQHPDPAAARQSLLFAQAQFLAANFVASAAASAQALQQDPKLLDAAIWHIAAMARLGLYPGELMATLAANAADLKPWPGPLLAWFQGRISFTAVQDAATDPNSSTVENHMYSFIFFHLASLAVAQGKLNKAEEALRALIDVGEGRDQMLLRAAHLELGRIVEIVDARKEAR